MKLNHAHGTQLRIGIGIAGVALAVLLGVALVATSASAAVGTYNVTLDDPANESIEVDVSFNASTDATVELTDGSTIYDTATISGNASETKTATLGTGAAEAGTALSVEVTSPSETDVSVAETRLLKTVPVTVSDAANETLAVDAVFDGDANATAAVTVTDSTGTDLLTDSLAYTTGDDTTVTAEYNASDGLADGDLTVDVAISPAGAYDAAYAQVNDDDATSGGGGLIGGDIAGQDPVVAIVGLLVIGGVGYYAREEGWV